jgi:outer membrane protein assembly factor BamB
VKSAILKYSVLMLAVAMSFSLAAQTRVTGHVFAEIVESAGASSRVSNQVVINPDQQTNGFDLGEITLSGGSMASCTVIITSGGIMGQSGYDHGFTATTSDDNSLYVLDASGKQKFRLNGSLSDEILSGNDKNYAAEYAVVFAYN